MMLWRVSGRTVDEKKGGGKQAHFGGWKRNNKIDETELEGVLWDDKEA
jgi:hypothetical protein